MKQNTLFKKSLFSFLALGLTLGGFINSASANLEDSEVTSSEAVQPETANPALQTLVGEKAKDESAEKYFETYEEADASGRRSIRRRRKRASDWGQSQACNNIHARVKAAVGGNNARANCYMGLFFMETTCNPNTVQAAGNAGNAHAAYGLCSLEKSSSIRRQNNRGPDCTNIEGVTNQVKCCRAIMRKTPRYFGPYIRGEVAQCG